MSAVERWQYFLGTICKLKIWEMEPTLFSRLKEPVQVYMSELAQMCHDRWKFKKEASYQTFTTK